MCHNNLNLKSEENWAAKPPPNTTERIKTQWLPKVDSWTMLNNPDFKVVEFDHFKKHAGLPNFTLSASEWIEKTNAIGLVIE